MQFFKVLVAVLYMQVSLKLCNAFYWYTVEYPAIHLCFLNAVQDDNAGYNYRRVYNGFPVSRFAALYMHFILNKIL